ncbi:protein Z-dependent protease inhibitor isoform X2 [Bombina bombina]|nr:protein Z-dependent protease inhibitor isoform X2 [Bombina bombina]XP_053545362.1 protein Z-dependent protease inhibitor isoform X2 [Bombina bombina]
MSRGLYLLLLLSLFLEVNSSSTKGGKGPKSDKYVNWKTKNQTSPKDLSNPFYLNHTNEELPVTLSVYNLTDMNSNFGFNLYRKMADKHDNNIFFSPFSMSFGLASLLLGAQGSTHKELLHGLNLNAFDIPENPSLLHELIKKLRKGITANDKLILDLGSFSFIHETFPIKEEFLNISKQYLDMEYQNIDFHNSSSKHIINNVVKKKSQGKIPDLYDEIDPQTKLLLLDYILFKGKWEYPFNPALTEMETFFIDKYNSVQVPMMYKKDKVSSMFDKELSCTVLKLDYKGNAHMLIVMPEKEGDFVTLEDHLTKELVDSWLHKMKSRKMDIFFPKFKLDQKYEMKKFLQELGIKNIFTGKANLTGMTEERNIKLTEVTQRAVIDIDEKGTEAAAATGSEITAFSLPPTIKVNNPFLFMIYEETYKSLLFIGRVIDPTKP